MNTKRLQLYECEICGNLVQVILPGKGDIFCCGHEMTLQILKKDNSELGEKHEPIINIMNDSDIEIKVENHPMVKEHYVQFIEGYSKDESELYLKYLTPGDKAVFSLSQIDKNLECLEYCNIHGLWGGKNND